MCVDNPLSLPSRSPPPLFPLLPHFPLLPPLPPFLLSLPPFLSLSLPSPISPPPLPPSPPLRPIQACSVSQSTPIGCCPSTAARWSACIVARDALKCLLTSSPSLTMPTETCCRVCVHIHSIYSRHKYTCTHTDPKQKNYCRMYNYTHHLSENIWGQSRERTYCTCMESIHVQYVLSVLRVH